MSGDAAPIRCPKCNRYELPGNCFIGDPKCPSTIDVLRELVAAIDQHEMNKASGLGVVSFARLHGALAAARAALGGIRELRL